MWHQHGRFVCDTGTNAVALGWMLFAWCQHGCLLNDTGTSVFYVAPAWMLYTLCWLGCLVHGTWMAALWHRWCSVCDIDIVTFYMTLFPHPSQNGFSALKLKRSPTVHKISFETVFFLKKIAPFMLSKTVCLDLLLLSKMFEYVCRWGRKVRTELFYTFEYSSLNDKNKGTD